MYIFQLKKIAAVSEWEKKQTSNDRKLTGVNQDLSIQGTFIINVYTPVKK